MRVELLRTSCVVAQVGMGYSWKVVDWASPHTCWRLDGQGAVGGGCHVVDRRRERVELLLDGILS